MTRTDDLSEFKRLAEAIKEYKWDLEIGGEGISWSPETQAASNYLRAISPANLLSLIARCETAEARVKELESMLNVPPIKFVVQART